MIDADPVQDFSSRKYTEDQQWEGRSGWFPHLNKETSVWKVYRSTDQKNHFFEYNTHHYWDGSVGDLALKEWGVTSEPVVTETEFGDDACCLVLAAWRL